MNTADAAGILADSGRADDATSLLASAQERFEGMGAPLPTDAPNPPQSLALEPGRDSAGKA